MVINSNTPFTAADDTNAALALWRVEERTLEQDLKSKRKIEARIYDLYKNNDLVRALIDKYVDSLIGKRVILQALPDYKALGVDKKAASKWAELVEREFHTYADSPDNWISANRSMDFTGICRHAARQELIHGEILGAREWRQSPLGYKTCVQMVTPNRLKNPPTLTQDVLKGVRDTTALTPVVDPRKVFEGIELDRYGAAKAYWIEGMSFNDNKTYSIYDPQTAKTEVRRYGKTTRFGWLQVYHIFEGLKSEYPRGISRLTSIIRKVKQLDRYSQADLDKAIISASYVFAITSDEDPESIADMLSGVDAHNSNPMSVGDTSLPAELVAKRQEIYDQLRDRYVKLKGGQIMHLFKGESIEAITPPMNQGSPSDFRKGHERSISNTVGMSYEIGSNDFTGVSFSGGQLSMGNFEHGLTIRRQMGVYKLAKLIFRSWLNEAILRGTIPLLGEKEYWPNREAYAKCSFTGTSRIYVDDVKRSRSNQIDLANGTTSRTAILAEAGGDFVQLAAERAREAQVLLDELNELAAENGIELSANDRMNFVTSIMATSAVKVPDNIGEMTTEELTEGL